MANDNKKSGKLGGQKSDKQDKNEIKNRKDERGYVSYPAGEFC